MSVIEEPWSSALVAAGCTDPRNGQRPSWNALARKLKASTSTLTAMAAGSKDTDQRTIDRVALELHLDPRLVSDWVGRKRTEWRPYEVPAEANLLSSEERDAVSRIILLLAASKKGRGETEDEPSEAPEKINDGGFGVGSRSYGLDATTRPADQRRPQRDTD